MAAKKHPHAIAWDAFVKLNPHTIKGPADGHFLYNRLMYAFMEGITAGQEILLAEQKNGKVTNGNAK